MSAADDRTGFLTIYLEDHVAGATAGVRRAARLADAESESSNAAALSTFAADVAADLDALLTLMEAMGVEPNRLKVLVASAAEKLGTLKPNGRIMERSPLSTIVELEAMQMAVRGKRSLWETLQVAVPLSTAVEFDVLIERADHQLATLSGIHADRVAATLAPPEMTEPTGPRARMELP